MCVPGPAPKQGPGQQGSTAKQEADPVHTKSSGSLRDTSTRSPTSSSQTEALHSGTGSPLSPRPPLLQPPRRTASQSSSVGPASPKSLCGWEGEEPQPADQLLPQSSEHAGWLSSGSERTGMGQTASPGVAPHVRQVPARHTPSRCGAEMVSRRPTRFPGPSDRSPLTKVTENYTER